MNYFYKTGSDRVFRGDGWSYAEWGCHSSIRSRSTRSVCYYYLGLCLAL